MRKKILTLSVMAVISVAISGCGVPQEGMAWRMQPSPPNSKEAGHEGKTDGSGEEPKSAAPADGTNEKPEYKPISPGVLAGWADDNQQYNYFMEYLSRFRHVQARQMNLYNRIIFTVVDSDGRPVPNCRLGVRNVNGKVICERSTYADGRAMFLPYEKGDYLPSDRFAVEVRADGLTEPLSVQFELTGPRNIEIRLPAKRQIAQPAPLDIVFVLDTTASMADEIARLKETIEAINYNITQMNPKPAARFGMVLYRDREDAYRCTTVAFMDDIEKFAKELGKVSAEGGGDEAEDMEEAIRQLNDKLQWRPDAVKLAFILTDAPPHLDYLNSPVTYLDSIRKAAEKGIKITTIGASGLKEQGEYILRQIAQYTMGLYVFLTYGEKGDSGPGTKALVSHHTGVNFEQRSLDSIVVRAVARELSNLSDKPVVVPEDYFEASPVDGQSNLHVLEQLFGQCARQIVDFSQIRLEKGSPTAVLPPTLSEGCDPKQANRLCDGLEMAVGKYNCFKLLERSQIKQIIDEKDLSSAYDLQPTTKPAKALAAKLLILSKLRQAGDRYEMMVKLVRADTYEVLSATVLKFSKDLLEEKEK